MNSKNKFTLKYKKNNKTYSVRLDRIIAVAAVLVILIVLLSACCSSCSKKHKSSKNDDSKEKISEMSTTEQNPALNSTTITLSQDDMHKGSLLLINAENKCLFVDGGVNLATIASSKNEFYSVTDSQISLDISAIQGLNEIMTDYNAATGLKNLTIFSGFRSQEQQQQKYSAGEASTPPGESEYHSGRTFSLGVVGNNGDVQKYNPEEEKNSWFSDNCSNYGFIERYPDGKKDLTGEEEIPYVFRYVGVPNAVYMKQNSLCLEEYLENIKNYTQEKPLKVQSGTSNYVVFYVPADSSGQTNVALSSDVDYSVSGNNTDGFIIWYPETSQNPAV